jgi:EAL domain-containing protein (putative c-di-GMP-specific phosphodiesterase class I)
LAQVPEALPHLAFEVTEDVFEARSSDMIKASIAELRRLGVAISLDDFGTGYASFRHLRELEFDELKIDGSFVSVLGQDAVAGVIVDGFLSIARGLGVDLVAEGLETEAQAQQLRARGCEVAQGFLFGKAVPPAHAAARLSAQTAPDARSAG